MTSDSVKSGFQVFTEDNKNTVDRSALATCYTLGGKRIERVSHNNPEKGYKCKVTLQTLSTDKVRFFLRELEIGIERNIQISLQL